MRIQIGDQGFELLHLNFQRLSRFKVFAFNCFLLAQLNHIHITADQLQFVSNFLKLNCCVVVFPLNGIFFHLEQDVQLFAQLRV